MTERNATIAKVIQDLTSDVIKLSVLHQEQSKSITAQQEHLLGRMDHIDRSQSIRIEALERAMWSRNGTQGVTETLRRHAEQLAEIRQKQTDVKGRFWQLVLPIVAAIISALILGKLITPKPILTKEEAAMFRERLYNLPPRIHGPAQPSDGQ